MSQTIKIIGLIFAIIAAYLPVRASGSNGGCETFVRSASLYDTDTVSVRINFRFDDATVLRDFKDNNIGFSRIESLMKEINCIDSISIIGFTSPDGLSAYNLSLAQQRAEAMQSYLYWRYPAARSIPINLHVEQDLVNALLKYIDQDNNVPRREKVVEVLSDESRSTDTRIANLKLIAGGSYDYINREIFPKMRMSVSYLLYYKTPNTTSQTDTSSCADTLHTTAPIAASDTTNITFVPDANTVNRSISSTYKPLFALKTNLLFDALTAINLEIEVPIGKRWSVAGELIFPWWLDKSKQRCFQLMNGNLEGRYWFGNRDVTRNGKPRQVMTGWFGGLYVGGGYYDLEWETKGYQGEFFIAAGLSGGYAHTINKKGNLRMEYSLGIGFMQTKYREYAPQQGGDVLMWQHNGKFTWFGPTRAKVSLVWMLNYKSKKGGVK